MTRHPLRDAVSMLVGLVLAVEVGSLWAWGTPAFWRALEGPQRTVPLVLGWGFAAWGVWQAARARMHRLSRGEDVWTWSVVLAMAMGGLLGLWAVFRLYYSRKFLLGASGVLWLWGVLRYILGTSRRRIRYGVVPLGRLEVLEELDGVEWVSLPHPRARELLDGLEGVVVDFPYLTPDWQSFLGMCAVRSIPVIPLPQLVEERTGRVPLQFLSGEVIQDLARPRPYVYWKTWLDRLLVFISSPLWIPLALATALLVWLDVGWPVLFVQERVGLGGRVFRLWKFRTMKGSGPRWTRPDDARVSALGRLLRRLHLDELPQFWNVLRGEMSVVGPRPEQVPIVAELQRRVPYYAYRHRVRPGMTGWAQIHQGYTDDVMSSWTKWEYDLYYVKHVSPWLDLWILLQTFRVVLTGRGAR